MVNGNSVFILIMLLYFVLADEEYFSRFSIENFGEKSFFVKYVSNDTVAFTSLRLASDFP